MKRIQLIFMLPVLMVALVTAQERPTTEDVTAAERLRSVTRPDLSEARLSPSQVIDPRVLHQLQTRVSDTSAHTSIAAEPSPLGVSSGSPLSTAAAVPRSGVTQPSMRIDLSKLSLRAGDLSNIRVFRSDRLVDEVAPAQESIAIKPGDVLAVQRDLPATIATTDDGSTVASSQTILYTVDQRGRTRELGLVHKTAGLHWVPDSSRFVGELMIGLLDRENENASEPVQANIPVQLLAAAGTLDRSQLEIERVGLPFQVIGVSVEGPDDPFKVELVSQIDLDLPPAELTVHRPRLSLLVPTHVQGLGVEAVDVTIGAVGAPLRPGQVITLDIDRGWLDKRTLEVGPLGTASTRLRSSGLGVGTLRLGAGVYFADPVAITFTVPWRFIIATLLGGVAGATVFVYTLSRKHPQSRRRYTMDWVVGVLIGSGATAMAYAGMRLPDWVPVPSLLVGEVVPFALAFICAAGGTAIIDGVIGVSRQHASTPPASKGR